MTVVAELARARTKLIPRMVGRGDLTVFVERGAMFVRADQLEHLAGIPPWSGGELLVDVDEWATIDGHTCYPLEVAIARCEAAGTPTAAAFLEWFDAYRATLDDSVLDQAQGMPGFIGSFPVARAAQLLSADPEIKLGRDHLYAYMHEIGWVQRGESDWEVTHLARRNGWLTVRPKLVPGRGRHPYMQPYVTPDGLTQLQQLLTVGRRHAPPAAPAPQTLFD